MKHSNWLPYLAVSVGGMMAGAGLVALLVNFAAHARQILPIA